MLSTAKTEVSLHLIAAANLHHRSFNPQALSVYQSLRLFKLDYVNSVLDCSQSEVYTFFKQGFFVPPPEGFGASSRGLQCPLPRASVPLSEGFSASFSKALSMHANKKLVPFSSKEFCASSRGLWCLLSRAYGASFWGHTVPLCEGFLCLLPRA